MKLTWILVLCLVATAVMAKDRSKKKDRNRNKRVKIEMTDEDDEYETIDVKQEGGQPEETLKNPCVDHDCKRGEVCVLEDRKAVCVCQTCDDPNPENPLKVCSTKNVTYESECHLDRDHCLCKNRQPGCSDGRANKIRLDYFQECKELTECPDDELDAFPARMRDWLFRSMDDMAMRGYEEMDVYREMLENARTDEMHVDAVIWKFCQLDVHPKDTQMTRRELLYIIASVKPMEHCLVPFLTGCDVNDDGNISLSEWGECLQLGHTELLDKCKENDVPQRG